MDGYCMYEGVEVLLHSLVKPNEVHLAVKFCNVSQFAKKINIYILPITMIFVFFYASK